MGKGLFLRGDENSCNRATCPKICNCISKVRQKRIFFYEGEAKLEKVCVGQWAIVREQLDRRSEIFSLVLSNSLDI
jgi:hypothetical protein